MTLVIVLTAFFASLLTLFSGFGLGTLLTPVAAVFFPVATAVALTALVHLLNNLFKLATLWRDVDWAIAFRFGLPALLAAIPGALLLTRLSEMPQLATYELLGRTGVVTPVKLAVGVLLIMFAFIEWFSMAKRVEIAPRHLPWGGLLSGFFGGLSGHQGAFRSAFLLHAGLDPPAFIASNAAIAAMVDVARLSVYGLNMSLLIDTVAPGFVAAAALAAFAGVLVGRAGVRKVTIGVIQKLVAVMLLGIGALLAAGLL